MSKRRVRFQTSIEESDESEARRIFLQFERGQSGHLDLKQFKQAVAELDVTNKAKVLHRYIQGVQKKGGLVFWVHFRGLNGPK